SLIFVCEKMLRDHVTIQMAWEFRKNFNLRVQAKGIDSAIESLLRYVKRGKVEPITKLYLTVCSENEKGLIK
ncbi:hypothetical protein, partial [Bacillus pumilus]|uniref:hypothetical protein n=1 Tax=Bacillus pumilus TaxID=1408 RepID=UPI001C92EAA4